MLAVVWVLVVVCQGRERGQCALEASRCTKVAKHKACQPENSLHQGHASRAGTAVAVPHYLSNSPEVGQRGCFCNMTLWLPESHGSQVLLPRGSRGIELGYG